jgi:uncharacterized membrane-anchored protein
MSSNKEGAAVIGVGVAACAVCCAGPIGGLLAAIGLGTAVGITAFGLLAVVFGTVAAFVVLRRRRRQQAAACRPATETVVLISGRLPSPVEPSSSSTGP